MQNNCDFPPPVLSVRKIPTNRRHVTGFVSWRGVESIPFESPLERDFVLRQEFSLAVASVVSQPCEVPFVTISGRSETYTPDYLVQYIVGDTASGWECKPLLVEVKPRSEWSQHWREWAPKWKAARRYAQEHGWTFHIVDESRIRTLALENINFLRRYKTYEFDREDSEMVIGDLRQLGAVSIDYLLAKHFPALFRAEGIAHMWHLLATRKLECDICDELSLQTEVWVP